MDYSNPESMFQNVDPIKTNPFWSGVQAGQNQAQAQPGMDINRAMQIMGLRKQQMENQEFASPEAMEARRSGLLAKSAENKGIIDKTPDMTAAEISKARAEIKAEPAMTAEKIAKAEQAASAARGKPQEDLIHTIGNSYDSIKAAPESKRPELWSNAVSQWEQTHPGVQVPERYRQWSPDRMTDLAATRYAQLHTPEFEQKMAEGKQKGEFGVKEHQISAAATVGAASIHARSAEKINTENLEAGKGIAQPGQILKLQKIMNDKESAPEEKQTAMAVLHDITQKEADLEISKDPGLKGLGEKMIMAQTPEERSTLIKEMDARKEKIRTDKLVDRNLMLPMLRQKYPDKSDNDLKAAFKKATGRNL